MHLRLFLVLVRLLCALAPLEQPDGTGITLGAWYDRLGGDTPYKINQRLNYKPLAFFQSDMNITNTLQSADIDQFVQQVGETKTDAFVYLTIYPVDGFEQVTDGAMDDLVVKVKQIVDTGRKVLIRYASEMNGSWFKYGQKPTAFKASFIKLVTKVRSVAGSNSVAFLWAPNSANGYPFNGGAYSATIKDSDFDPTLDTDKNGLFDHTDDPYSPYYPGDEYVDWVGFSIYHYGANWFLNDRWDTNDIPELSKAETIIHGRPDPVIGDRPGFQSGFDFYEMFSGSGKGGIPESKSKGGKPFFITETGATVHLTRIPNIGTKENPVDGPEEQPPNTDPKFRAAMKQAWWRQMLNQTFLEMHPKIKGMAFFEFIKFEEKSLRDFTTLGKGTDKHSRFGNDGGDMDGDTLAAFQDDLKTNIGRLIRWGSPANVNVLSSAPFYDMQFSPKMYILLSVLYCFL